MPSLDGDPIQFNQNRFEDACDKVRNAAIYLAKLTTRKRRIAYILKAIAVFGGIAITAGIKGTWSQVVGILIMIAAGVDLIWSNHRRLLAETEAKYAYEALLENVENTHTGRLGRIIDLKKKNPEEAKRQLLELLEQLISKLNNGKELIRRSLNKVDLESLRTLALEEKADQKGSTPLREDG